MKGPVEYNKIGRNIDFKLLNEAIDSDYKPVLKEVENYYLRYKTPPSYEVLAELIEEQETLFLVSELAEDDCQESEVLFYLDQIRNRFNSQLAIRLVNSISKNNDIDIEEFNQNLVNISSKVERLKKSSVFSEGHLSDSVEERINQYLFTEENPHLSSGVLSGFPELDEYLNGIKESEMMVIVGASSSGKSLLMLNYAINAWLGSNTPQPASSFLDDGKNILYFTLEMTKKQVEQRLDANLADVRHKALTRGYLEQDEKARWMEALDFQKIYPKKFYLVDIPRGSRTLDIEASYNRIVAEFKPDLVVVDYLGLMKPNHDFGQDWLEIGQVSADLHEFCRNKNIAVLTAAQKKAKNKNAKSQANDTEEIGRSKMIGDNSNIVLMIENRDDELLREDAIIHITKNRDGAKGEIKLFKDFEKSKFKSIPDNWSVNLGDENAI